MGPALPQTAWKFSPRSNEHATKAMNTTRGVSCASANHLGAVLYPEACPGPYRSTIDNSWPDILRSSSASRLRWQSALSCSKHSRQIFSCCAFCRSACNSG